MVEDSADFQRMPGDVKHAIEQYMLKHEHSFVESESPNKECDFSLLVPALAALVVRLGRTALIDQKMIVGIDWRHGASIGLRPEDRKAMALVSRACLMRGRPDHGSEIHQLLAMCTQPLGNWLDLPEVLNAGLAETVLVHPDESVPTLEAEELAKNFSSMTATLEEQIFSRFIELLEKNPQALIFEYYTAVREFVVRHPLAADNDFATLRNSVPSILMHCVQTQFYELVPDGWAPGGTVVPCAHCGNSMRPGKIGLVCRTQACASALPAAQAEPREASGLYRLVRSIRQYWHEPGVDEIRLLDALANNGITAELYPMRDQVDIAVGDIGIDLKSYSSPELLGAKLRKSLGGLAFYDQKWLVVPDWLVARTPAYLERLKNAMEDKAKTIRCLSVKQAIKELTNA